jgi:hypothetical protein
MWMLGYYEEILREERFLSRQILKNLVFEVIFRDHLYCWTLETIIQMNRPNFKRKCLVLKLSFLLLNAFMYYQVILLGAFEKLREATTIFVMSIRPSSWNNSAPNGQISMKFGI